MYQLKLKTKEKSETSSWQVYGICDCNHSSYPASLNQRKQTFSTSFLYSRQKGYRTWKRLCLLRLKLRIASTFSSSPHGYKRIVWIKIWFSTYPSAVHNILNIVIKCKDSMIPWSKTSAHCKQTFMITKIVNKDLYITSISVLCLLIASISLGTLSSWSGSVNPRCKTSIRWALFVDWHI